MKLYLRDTLGRFQPKNRLVWQFILGSFATAGVLGLVAQGLNEWNRYDHVIQKPIVVLVSTRPIIESTPKTEKIVLSPIAKALTQDMDTSNLTDIEKMILEVFGERNFQIARAVAKCESGLDPEAISHTKDIGLFQINLPVWKQAVKDEFGFTVADLFDPEINTRVAYWIFDRDGDGIGSWNPWVTHNNGCFLAFL